MSRSRRKSAPKETRKSKYDRRIRFEQLEARELLASDLVNGAASLASYKIDGTGNNTAHPSWGSAGTDLLRTAPAQYGDGVSSLAGSNRPSPRAISNAVVDQGTQDIIDDRQLSAMTYAWGQFIDHDIDLTNTGTDKISIAVPTGDPYFDPNSTGTKTIDTTRSLFDSSTGTSTSNPRQQINSITSFLDGSMIYGSDNATASALRTFTDGKLKSGAGNMLPLNTTANFPNGTLNMATMPGVTGFAAGDVRANENVELTSLQTLFMREHNYWAGQVKTANPTWTDEQIYQRARSIVIAEIQSITYNQWLPTLLGQDAIKPYNGYKSQVNPSIANEFSTAAFRFGHSMVGDDVEFLDNNGNETRDEISLSQAFFNPSLVSQTGIDPLLKYLASDPSSAIDTKVVGSLRNFLFGPPGAGGFDLPSLNIERGRDHGLADYNTTRQAYGLPKVTSFDQITSNKDLQAKLKQLYGSVNNIDLWVGALAEDHVRGSSVGQTLKTMISDQFTRLRDGDRLWYQNNFSGNMLQQINNTTLADIIRRDSGITNLQQNVFIFDAHISGTVFGDGNHNNRLDGTERGVANRTVQLVDDSGDVISTTKTDSVGKYLFDVNNGLRTGNYQIVVLSADGSKTEVTSQKLAVTRGGQFLDGINLAVAAGNQNQNPPPANNPPANNGGTKPAGTQTATSPTNAAPTNTSPSINPAAVDVMMSMQGGSTTKSGRT